MEERSQKNRLHAPAAGRIIGGVFGFMFLGMGLTVIFFLWLQPLGEFGSPPLVFRLFGSFIAIGFVAVGGGVAYGAITGHGMQRNLSRLNQRIGRATHSDRFDKRHHSYSCTKCGAPLDGSAEVSPHGDVKCPYCNAWFNIHHA